MPKSSKKRKEKVADFSKAKLKLGKGKQIASNAIDTSFKARSIALPTQSIVVETSAPTTRRKLTFEDLISQLKHHSPGTRKDAILGLKELLECHWDYFESFITTVLHTTARILGDEDAGVRKTLLLFFGWLLPRIPEANLTPRSSLLLLFTTSAQTHIFPEIRVDAVRFLDLFLEYIPATVVEGWSDNKGHGRRVLEGYLGILNAGSKFGDKDGPMKATSTASVVLTPASRLVVIRSLATFLEIATNSVGGKEHIDSNALYLSLLEKYFSRICPVFEHLLPSTSRQGTSFPWQEKVIPEDMLDNFVQSYTITEFKGKVWTMQDLQDILDSSDYLHSDNDTQDPHLNFIIHLARSLYSTLIATFLDCAPSAFSPSLSPSDTDVQLVLSVARIAASLYGTTLQSGENENIPAPHIADLQSLLGYMTPYFPFHIHGSRDAKQLVQAFQDLNLIYCKLVAQLISSTNQSCKPILASSNQRHTLTHVALAEQTESVSTYIISLLRRNSGQSEQPLTASDYVSLLPAIWALINSSANRRLVLQALLDHAIKTPSKSSVKALSVAFVGRLAILDTDKHYRGLFRLGCDASEDLRFQEWLLHLPQTLWELGHKNVALTELILSLLLRIIQRRSRLVEAKIMKDLRSRLAPYFVIKHATRGEILGPYSKLPPTNGLQRLALCVVVLLRVAEKGRHHGDLEKMVDIAVMNTDEQDYWNRVADAFDE